MASKKMGCDEPVDRRQQMLELIQPFAKEKAEEQIRFSKKMDLSRAD